MKYLGILIIVFGLVDMAGSYLEFDVWTDYIGVQLPAIVWKFSAYAEIALGYGIMSLGSKEEETTQD